MKYLALLVLLLTAACSPKPAPEPQFASEYERLRALNTIEEPEDSAFVLALAYATSLEGMRAAARGDAGTFVLARDQILMFVWEVEHYPAFAIIDLSAELPIQQFALKANGNATVGDIKSVSSLIRVLQDTGWINVPHGQVPKYIVEALATQTSWVATMGIDSLPTFLLLPTWVEPEDLLEEYYPQEET